MAAFADEIGKYPMFFSPLQILDAKGRQFSPAEATAQHDGHHGVIPKASQGLPIEHTEQTLSLFSCEPISDPNAELLGTFHALDSGGEIRAEQSAVCGFIR